MNIMKFKAYAHTFKIIDANFINIINVSRFGRSRNICLTNRHDQCATKILPISYVNNVICSPSNHSLRLDSSYPHQIQLSQDSQNSHQTSQVSRKVVGYKPYYSNIQSLFYRTKLSALGNFHKYHTSSLTLRRFASTASESIPDGYVPDIPVPVLPSDAPAVVLNALGEESLSSLGLGSMTPPGIYQQFLEMIHVGFGIPWYMSIIVTTVFLRTMLFPFVIYGQRNTAALSNHLPVLQRMQAKIQEARMEGDSLGVARATNDAIEYGKRNEISPMKAMMMPFIQTPIFMSVFFGIRQITNADVLSMKLEGFLWINSLTIPDPTYLLPILTATTLFVTIETGIDGAQAKSMSHNIKWAMRILPFAMLPFLINFPTAMCLYWLSSNVLSLMQVTLLRIPKVREYFNIPEIIKSEEDPATKKGFMEGFKDNYQNSKIMKEVEARSREEATRLERSSQGPIPRTYNFDPTKLAQELKKKSGSG